jgi:hypothetical protein
MGTLSERMAEVDALAAMRRYLWALLIAPPLVGAIFYAINPDLPGPYVSRATLRMDAKTAASLDIERTNPRLADLFYKNDPAAGRDTEARTRWLFSSVMVRPVDRNAEGADRLYALTVLDMDRKAAQSIAQTFLSEWLRVTHPPVNPASIIEPPDLPTVKVRASRSAAAFIAAVAAGVIVLGLALLDEIIRRLAR